MKGTKTDRKANRRRKQEQDTEYEAAQVALEAEKMELIKEEAEAELEKALPHLRKAE